MIDMILRHNTTILRLNYIIQTHDFFHDIYHKMAALCFTVQNNIQRNISQLYIDWLLRVSFGRGHQEEPLNLNVINVIQNFN